MFETNNTIIISNNIITNNTTVNIITVNINSSSSMLPIEI